MKIVIIIMIIIIIIIISHLHNLRSASWLWRISRGVWSQSETVKCFEYHNNVKHGRRTFWRKSAWPGNQSPCYFFFCSSSSRLKFKVCDKIFTKKNYFYHLIFFFSVPYYIAASVKLCHTVSPYYHRVISLITKKLYLRIISCFTQTCYLFAIFYLKEWGRLCLWK